jgi:predicted Zn-dependent protease
VRTFLTRAVSVVVAGLLLALVGCAINPVTGERNLVGMSVAQEIELGRQQYAPTQQVQGGPFIVDAELTRYVQEVGARLAAVADAQLPYEFVVVNDSIPNAWALPGGKIAIHRGLLLELGDEAELAAVLGHEIVHAAARHTSQQIARAQIAQVGAVALGVGYGNRRGAELVVGGAQLGAQMILATYGRDAEREADQYGMEYMRRAGYDPAAAVRLQQTFVRLSEGRRADFLSGLFASHPPSPERVALNEATLARLGAGGETGAERYRQRTAMLRKLAPAYAAYDRGRKALAGGDAAAALAAAREAQRLAPAEALFDGLEGAALSASGRDREAIAAFDRAIARNAGYFLFPLQRGLSRLALRQRAAARTDLEASVALLPTARAHAALGRLALDDGDVARARQHFELAAGAGGDIGAEAAEQVERIDLQGDPGRVLRVVPFAAGGVLAAEVANPTGVALADVDVEFLARSPLDGRVAREQRRIASLPAGGAVRVASRLPAVEGGETAVRILSVRPLEGAAAARP